MDEYDRMRTEAEISRLRVERQRAQAELDSKLEQDIKLLKNRQKQRDQDRQKQRDQDRQNDTALFQKHKEQVDSCANKLVPRIVQRIAWSHDDHGEEPWDAHLAEWAKWTYACRGLAKEELAPAIQSRLQNQYADRFTSEFATVQRTYHDWDKLSAMNLPWECVEDYEHLIKTTSTLFVFSWQRRV